MYVLEAVGNSLLDRRCEEIKKLLVTHGAKLLTKNQAVSKPDSLRIAVDPTLKTPFDASPTYVEF